MPDDITPDDVQRLQQVALNAAAEYSEGQLSQDDYLAVLAGVILEAKGVPDPNPIQIRDQVSELNTATSFISSGLSTPNN